MTSTRLPGKILLPLGGRPVLEHVVSRCKRAHSVHEVVVAVPDQPASEPIAALCARLSTRVVRGSEQDVLSRYVLAANESAADVVIRITSDCPLIEPLFIDLCVTELLASRTSAAPYDYFCNVEPRRLPRGLDVEVFTVAALRAADEQATTATEREHVTTYLRTSGRFRTGGMRWSQDHSELRWTLDTAEDHAMFERLFAVAEGELDFATALAIVNRDPSIHALNAAVAQKLT